MQFIYYIRPTLNELKEQQYTKNFMQQQDNQRLENYHNYLYLWIEILISSIKNWHKFKNIVKLVDFLISYSFNAESRENSGHRFINPDLLDEFMTYVRSDFGIFSSETLSSYIADHQSSPANSLNDLDQLGTSSSNQSSWMQPPLSWISSSFYSVVNNTATQLSGTVGAAINAVNTTAISFASLSTGDFDSNQIQQFSYDKRLYKEFPLCRILFELIRGASRMPTVIIEHLPLVPARFERVSAIERLIQHKLSVVYRLLLAKNLAHCQQGTLVESELLVAASHAV